MREKEIAEIRRRYRSDKSNISRICGCYVDSKKEIISEFDQSLGMMSEEDANGMLGLLKKALSGRIGTNLLEIEFSTEQVNRCRILCSHSVRGYIKNIIIIVS